MSQMTFVPYGVDSPAGEYRCVDCGFELTLDVSAALPPCPQRDTEPHQKLGWEVKSGCAAVPASDCRK